MLRTCLGWLCFFAGVAWVSAEDPKPREPGPYVEFDFSSLPRDGEGKYSLTLTVLTTDKDLKYSMESETPRKFDPEVTCAAFAVNMKANRFKAEVVDKTKLRVYGRTFNDKLIPATKGMVESSDLRPEELPKVKNPEKKG
jgi:hypothetical protein